MNDAQVSEIIKKAHKAFKRADKLAREKRDNENEIRLLCREYGEVTKVWGWQSHMLRQAVEARIGKKIA